MELKPVLLTWKSDEEDLYKWVCKYSCKAGKIKEAIKYYKNYCDAETRKEEGTQRDKQFKSSIEKSEMLDIMK